MKAHYYILPMLLAVSSVAMAQNAPPARPQELSGEQLFNEWFSRLNALDDWFITMDGKEQPEQVVDALLALYATDAVQFVGPNERQIGMVTLSGLDAIRKWVDQMARTRRQIAWRLSSRTMDEKTAGLMVVPAPWGGSSV